MKPLRLAICVLTSRWLSIFFLSEISALGCAADKPLFLGLTCIRSAVRHAMTKPVPARRRVRLYRSCRRTRILRALDFGVMMGVAGPMKREEREAAASFLGTGAAEAGPSASAFCSAGSRLCPVQRKEAGTAGARILRTRDTKQPSRQV